MVNRLGNHVSILKQERLERAIANKKLRNEILSRYFTNDLQQFDVSILTTGGETQDSTFTAMAIVQLTNQNWVKSIAPRGVVRTS